MAQNWIKLDKSTEVNVASNKGQSFNMQTTSVQYIQDLFTKFENSIYSLRSNNGKLALPRPRLTNFLKRRFSYKAAQGWNELSSKI
jgi:hypothetical protein